MEYIPWYAWLVLFLIFGAFVLLVMWLEYDLMGCLCAWRPDWRRTRRQLANMSTESINSDSERDLPVLSTCRGWCCNKRSTRGHNTHDTTWEYVDGDLVEERTELLNPAENTLTNSVIITPSRAQLPSAPPRSDTPPPNYFDIFPRTRTTQV